MSESTEAHAERGRRNIEGRWGPYRAARVAAGLPATKELEKGRVVRFITDPDTEALWLAEVERLGLVPASADRTAKRLAAKRLASSVTADLGQYDADAPSSTPEGDDDVLVAYWGAEAARYRRRADRDAAMARQHHELADEAERAMARVILRRGGGK